MRAFNSPPLFNGSRTPLHGFKGRVEAVKNCVVAAEIAEDGIYPAGHLEAEPVVVFGRVAMGGQCGTAALKAAGVRLRTVGMRPCLTRKLRQVASRSRQGREIESVSPLVLVIKRYF